MVPSAVGSPARCSEPSKGGRAPRCGRDITKQGKDGTNSGFDLELIKAVKGVVKIPVIASSGAGRPEHFVEVFEGTEAEAALGAGIFHHGEYTVGQVKTVLAEKGFLVREAEKEIGEEE